MPQNRGFSSNTQDKSEEQVALLEQSPQQEQEADVASVLKQTTTVISPSAEATTDVVEPSSLSGGRRIILASALLLTTLGMVCSLLFVSSTRDVRQATPLLVPILHLLAVHPKFLIVSLVTLLAVGFLRTFVSPQLRKTPGSENYC